MTPSSSSNGGSMHQKQPPANLAVARPSPPAPCSAATAVLTRLMTRSPPVTKKRDSVYAFIGHASLGPVAATAYPHLLILDVLLYPKGSGGASPSSPSCPRFRGAAQAPQRRQDHDTLAGTRCGELAEQCTRLHSTLFSILPPPPGGRAGSPCAIPPVMSRSR